MLQFTTRVSSLYKQKIALFTCTTPSFGCSHLRLNPRRQHRHSPLVLPDSGHHHAVLSHLCLSRLHAIGFLGLLPKDKVLRPAPPPDSAGAAGVGLPLQQFLHQGRGCEEIVEEELVVLVEVLGPNCCHHTTTKICRQFYFF